MSKEIIYISANLRNTIFGKPVVTQLKEKLDMNLTTIGGHFGGKDHSTVISSIRKIEEAIKEEFLFKKEIEGLRQKIVE